MDHLLAVGLRWVQQITPKCQLKINLSAFATLRGTGIIALSVLWTNNNRVKVLFYEETPLPNPASGFIHYMLTDSPDKGVRCAEWFVEQIKTVYGAIPAVVINNIVEGLPFQLLRKLATNDAEEQILATLKIKETIKAVLNHISKEGLSDEAFV